MDIKRLKPIVNDPAYAVPFGEYLDHLHMAKLREMENAVSVDELRKAQGYILCIKQMKALKEKVNA